MDNLSKKHCVPCEGNVPPLTPEQARDLMPQVPEWKLSEDAKKLSRSFAFKDFKTALAFVNEIGKVAEEEWHHPQIKLGWGRVDIETTTHSIRGLSENDFILAAKIDQIEKQPG